MRQGGQGRQGDKETRRQGRKLNHAISQNKVVRLLGRAIIHPMKSQ